MSSATSSTGWLDVFLAAAPRGQRAALRILLSLASRPRGAALLGRLAPLDQVADGLLAFGRYDDPRISRELGWDGEAVVGRGRELRRSEGRP
jgi:hypothetical protein